MPPPRSRTQSLLDRSLLLRAYGFLGLIEAAVGMAAFFLVWWSHGYGLTALQAVTPALLSHTADATTTAIYAQATTLTLAAIVACQDGNLFACRSEKLSILRLGVFSNPLLWLGIGLEWVLVLSIIHVTPLQRIFFTLPLAPWQWLLLLVCPPILLGAEELRKRWLRRSRSSSRAQAAHAP